MGSHPTDRTNTEDTTVSQDRRRAGSQGRQTSAQRPPGAGARETGARKAPAPEAGLRAAILRHSAVPLVFLSRLPRWILPVLLAALLVAALAAEGWVGVVPTVVLAAVLGWLAFLSWPSLNLPARLLRVAGLVLLAALALGHIGIKP